MSTFAGALGRGLAGYAQNRERAMAREEELAQQQRAEARQAMLDERQRVQMEAQAEALREQRERQAMLDDRMREQDRNTALDSGLRDTEPTRQMGTLMSGAAELGSSMGGGMGATMGALGGYGRAAQAAAESPTQYRVGGKPMVRAAESMAERTARMSTQQRLGERMADREYDTQRDLQNFNQQKELAKYTRSLQPRPEANMQVIQTADGPMAFNPRTGETKPILANGQQVQGPRADNTPNTDGARKAAGFLLRMKGATDTFDQLEPTGPADPKGKAKMSDLRPNIGQAMLGAIPFVGDQLERSSYNENQGAYDTAKRDFLAAVLRKESGAQINNDEWNEGNRRYFAVRGDTPEIALQKRKNRAQAMQATEIEAGMRSPSGAAAQSTLNARSVNTDAIRSQAVQAIQRGANPAAVRKRYEETTGQRWEE